MVMCPNGPRVGADGGEQGVRERGGVEHPADAPAAIASLAARRDGRCSALRPMTTAHVLGRPTAPARSPANGRAPPRCSCPGRGGPGAPPAGGAPRARQGARGGSPPTAAGAERADPPGTQVPLTWWCSFTTLGSSQAWRGSSIEPAAAPGVVPDLRVVAGVRTGDDLLHPVRRPGDRPQPAGQLRGCRSRLRSPSRSLGRNRSTAQARSNRSSRQAVCRAPGSGRAARRRRGSRPARTAADRRGPGRAARWARRTRPRRRDVRKPGSCAGTTRVHVRHGGAP